MGDDASRLVRRAMAGEKGAFGALCARCYGETLTLAMHLARNEAGVVMSALSGDTGGIANMLIHINQGMKELACTKGWSLPDVPINPEEIRVRSLLADQHG